MATEFISTCNKTGEDYNTVGLWESATQADLTSAATKVFSHGGITGVIADGASVTGATSGATGTVCHATATQIMVKTISDTFQTGEQMRVDVSNYVTLSNAGDSVIAVLEIYDDQGEIDAAWTVAGATTNSTNYRVVRGAVGERHDGSGSTDVGAKCTYTATNPYTPAVSIQEGYFVLEWMRLSRNGSDGGNYGVVHITSDSSKYVTIRNNVFEKSFNTHASYVFYGVYYNGNVGASGGPIYVYNNVFNRIESNGILLLCGWTPNPNVYAYNNTSYNCSQGTSGSYANRSIIKNGIASSIGGWGTVTTTGTMDATGSAGLQNLVAANEFVSVTTDAEDLHLKAGATSINAGTDLGSPYNIDIDGQTRPTGAGTWDIGADEITSQVYTYTGNITLALLPSHTFNFAKSAIGSIALSLTPNSGVVRTRVYLGNVAIAISLSSGVNRARATLGNISLSLTPNSEAKRVFVGQGGITLVLTPEGFYLLDVAGYSYEGNITLTLTPNSGGVRVYDCQGNLLLNLVPNSSGELAYLELVRLASGISKEVSEGSGMAKSASLNSYGVQQMILPSQIDNIIEV